MLQGKIAIEQQSFCLPFWMLVLLYQKYYGIDKVAMPLSKANCTCKWMSHALCNVPM